MEKEHRYAVEYWRGKNGRWYWHLKCRANGQIMHPGGESDGYATRDKLFVAVARVKRAWRILGNRPPIYVGD